MKKIVVILIFVSGCCLGYNDSLLTDTTIYFHELSFRNEIEQNVLNDHFNGKLDNIFSLLYVIGDDVALNDMKASTDRLETLIETFRTKSFNRKKENKKIEIIYQETHKEFFTKYELRNGFDEVFKRGNYNCVSATALFAIILDKIDIPYAIKVLPTHVYLVAYPKDKKVVIETTDPVTGYYQYDRKFQQKFVDQLVMSKMISKEEFLNKGYEILFNEHFFSQVDISMVELAGLQYFNKGLYDLDDENDDRAVINMEKAMFLYPSTRVAFTMVATYANLLKSNDYSDTLHVDYLFRLLRYKELIADDQLFIGEFHRVTEKQLTEKNDTAYYVSIYNRLMENTEDETLKKEFSLIYYLNMAQRYYDNLQLKKSEEYVRKAFELERDNQKLLNDYVMSILRYLESLPDKKQAMDYLSKTEKELPEVLDNPKYMAYKADVLARLMAQAFELNKRSAGENYRSSLEQLLGKGVNSHVIKQNIAIAYANAASCYYRIGAKTKARSLLNKGLEFVPDSYELKTRLKMIR